MGDGVGMTYPNFFREFPYEEKSPTNRYAAHVRLLETWKNITYGRFLIIGDKGLVGI